MKLRAVLIAFLFSLACGIAVAHGNKVHVLGTLEKINADSVVVKTKGGKAVEVKLAASTVYVARSSNQDRPAKLSDLALGTMVVIHATPKDNGLEADEIKFTVAGSSVTPKAAPPAAPKPQS